MKRFSLALTVVLVPAFSAQVASQAPLTPVAPIVVAPVPAASAPATPATDPAVAPRPRAISSETAAKLAVNAPKFSPPKTGDAKKADLPDLREIDKPRNRIIRLPQEIVEAHLLPRTPPEGASPDVLQLPAYIVREEKVPEFKERELLTPQGKLNLAYKRHPGLRFGSLFFLSNDGIARAMLEEEFELERKAERADLLGLYRYSDPATQTAARQISHEAVVRQPASDTRRRKSAE